MVELVRTQREKRKRILRANHGKLDTLTKQLHEKETIAGDAFMAALE